MRKIYQLSEKIKFKRSKERVKENEQKEKPLAPLRNECSICGNHELLLFKCSYCKNIYCSEHQLPEKHDCQILKKNKRFKIIYIKEKLMQKIDGKITISPIIQFIVGIWVLVWGISGLIMVISKPMLYYEHESGIAIVYLFYVTIAYFLFCGAFYSYKKNREKVLKISYINIFISILFFAFTTYCFKNLMVAPQFIIPVIIASSLAILFVEKQ